MSDMEKRFEEEIMDKKWVKEYYEQLTDSNAPEQNKNVKEAMDKHFEEAKALYESKQYDKAVAVLEEDAKAQKDAYYDFPYLTEFARAMSLLETIANEGYAGAQYLFGSRCERTNKNKSVEYLRKAAEQGHPDAQYLLSYSIFLGLPKAEQNEWLGKAAEGYIKSAKQGDSHAVKMLTEIESRGIAPDSVVQYLERKEKEEEEKEKKEQEKREVLKKQGFLTWEDFDEIALALRKKHHDISPVPLKRDDIRKMALELETFKDVETPNEFYLRAVQSKWIRLMHEGEAETDPREVCP